MKVALNDFPKEADLKPPTSERSPILQGEERIRITFTSKVLTNSFVKFLSVRTERFAEEILKRLPSSGTSFDLIDDSGLIGGNIKIARLEDDKDGTINLLISR